MIDAIALGYNEKRDVTTVEDPGFEREGEVKGHYPYGETVKVDPEILKPVVWDR